MARIRINTRNHNKEKPYLINSYFFGRAKKKVNRVSKNTCMYVSAMCAEGIFVNFPWWLKNAKSRSKIALFSNERHFEIWFPKQKTITFFWRKLSIHKKNPILHVTTTFSLKQGETRTSSGPISSPLKRRAFHKEVPTTKITTDTAFVFCFCFVLFCFFFFCVWRHVAYEVLHVEEGGYLDSNTLYILDDGHANDRQFDHSRQMLMMVPPKITISVLVIYLTFRPI